MRLELLNDFFLYNLFDHIPLVFSYFFSCLGAIFSGIVVGKEREKAQKAAGLRTFAMVAMGACVFTLTSRLFDHQQMMMDGARIPAQIVTGVGFLGAGAVFRSGRVINGLTTAAGIWATAAVGMVFGLGYFVFGLSVTFLIFVLLWIPTYLDKKTLFEHEWVYYMIHVDNLDGKGPILVREIIMDWGHKVEVMQDQQDVVQLWRIQLSTRHRPHQRFLSELATQRYVKKIEIQAPYSLQLSP
ncbi:MgtC/SapB family protein [Peredibacter starrii]|uniref:MgtC/SapB family protein n=1 Tax=Peredibacter starrii TaxID=28202 RepID=A0AAX4HM74_9BACT|nr:MgtC/SapB family protein [Peredibacter starrii]WPU64360.1 MgtC/SapB family protein [Peredibacter starrii]